jgi:hypothetical protein
MHSTTETLCLDSSTLIALQSTSIAKSMSDLPKKVGWIGLGVMGGPMLSNLVGKMEIETQFYVYDVVQKSIDDIVEEGRGRVHACGSSKEVADSSVSLRPNTRLAVLPKLTIHLL